MLTQKETHQNRQTGCTSNVLGIPTYLTAVGILDVFEVIRSRISHDVGVCQRTIPSDELQCHWQKNANDKCRIERDNTQWTTDRGGGQITSKGVSSCPTPMYQDDDKMGLWVRLAYVKYTTT